MAVQAMSALKTPRIRIGIHVHSQPENLHATLEALRVNTRVPFELLLLPDGPDPCTSVCLATLARIPQSATAEPRGAAACFNRLALAGNADLFVFLESGSIVGPGWIEKIIAALLQAPRNALAGPSTNRSWNEQCITHHASARQFGNPDGSSLSEVAAVAAAVQKHFKTGQQSLEPLHSLADFCYAVRREVVDAIGAAEERFGLGPCWEMDYNIRAARAGFRGVWACTAYVHRMLFSPRRILEEERHFEASRRLYQDKFCGLRLRQERAEYEPHCRGEACEHFAPPMLINLQIPLRPGVTPVLPPPRIEVFPSTPLVSCIMPTRDRPDFVRQSIQYFQRQDYPHLELLILDDGPIDLTGTLGGDSRVRYVRLPTGQTIGAKRNRGCELARGKFVAHWDDDDWYAPNRISSQVAPLLAGRADVTGFTREIFFDLDRWQFWSCSPELHKRMFVEDVHGGTLVFDRKIFERGVRYPHGSLAEDAAFLKLAVRRGSRLERISAGASFLYLRHSASSWKFPCGQFLDSNGWHQVSEPACFLQDRAFYTARSATQNSGNQTIAAADPLVTCIMPTAGRPSLAAQAIRYFQHQDYPRRELLILDEGQLSLDGLVLCDPRIRYLRQDGPRSLGTKRNLACDLAQGELIAHWDDDDWSAPDRLSRQVRALQENSTSQICGLSRLYFFDPLRPRAWVYEHVNGNRPWVAGGTMCYWKAFWQRHPFPDITEGEDTRFVWADRSANVHCIADSSWYVATVHAKNTSPKRTGDSHWRVAPVGQVRELLRNDWSFYEQWRAAGIPPSSPLQEKSAVGQTQDLSTGQSLLTAATTAGLPAVSAEGSAD